MARTGRPAGTFRHFVPAGQSIVKEHARLIAERFLATANETVSIKRAVIVGEESLVVNGKFSISIAARFTSTPEAFLTEFKPTGSGRPTSRFGTGIHWIHAKSIHFEDGIQWL